MTDPTADEDSQVWIACLGVQQYVTVAVCMLYNVFAYMNKLLHVLNLAMSTDAILW